MCDVTAFSSGFSVFYICGGTTLLFVATTLYILVLRRARQQLAQITREIERFHGRQQALQDEITRSRSIGYIFGVFIVCWFPFVIMAPLHLFYSLEDLVVAHEISVSFGMLNSSLNCFVYGLRNKEFQQGFKKLKSHINRQCCRCQAKVAAVVQSNHWKVASLNVNISWSICMWKTKQRAFGSYQHSQYAMWTDTITVAYDPFEVTDKMVDHVGF